MSRPDNKLQRCLIIFTFGKKKEDGIFIPNLNVASRSILYSQIWMPQKWNFGNCRTNVKKSICYPSLLLGFFIAFSFLPAWICVHALLVCTSEFLRVYTFGLCASMRPVQLSLPGRGYESRRTGQGHQTARNCFATDFWKETIRSLTPRILISFVLVETRQNTEHGKEWIECWPGK